MDISVTVDRPDVVLLCGYAVVIGNMVTPRPVHGTAAVYGGFAVLPSVEELP